MNIFKRLLGHKRKQTREFQRAFEVGDLATAEKLLEDGLAPNARIDDQDNTPLHKVALNGNTEVGYLLLKRGANVDGTNAFGQTALHLAA